jgi:hypothetical protein
MAIGLISGALGIAKLIPDVIDLFSGKDDKGKTEVARDVIELGSRAVETVTGKKFTDPAVIERELQENQQAQLALAELYAENKHELEKAYLADRADARDMYKETNNPTTNKIAMNIIHFNMLYVVVAVAIQVGCMFFLRDFPNLLVLIGNIVGIIVGNLLQERTNVLSFFFGSSMGSKAKDAVKNAFTNSVSK